MVMLLLGSMSAPTSLAMPMPQASAEQLISAEPGADDQHACCPSVTADEAVQTVTELAASHLDCDNSCSDCQHICHAGSAGLLSATHFEAAHAVSERSRLDAGTAHFSTSPLERPPHRN